MLTSEIGLRLEEDMQPSAARASFVPREMRGAGRRLARSRGSSWTISVSITGTRVMCWRVVEVGENDGERQPES